MSIEAKNVSKYYGTQAALKDVTFSAKKGEIVGFLGPNGAGKSTMMKIITCYIPPTEGKVSVAGLNIFEDDLKIKSKVGYLPETNPLYPEMYIREYLHFVAGMYNVKNKKERVEEMISLVGLERESHKKIGALSKGYKQRVGIAQALIHDPEVVILDEPTSGLDPNQLDEIRDLIKRVGKEKTVLLSTHIMQEVEAICDRVIIIKLGEIVADSSVSELKQKSEQDIFILKLNDSLNTHSIESIEGVLNAVEMKGNLYHITANKNAGIGPKLSALVASEGLEIEEMKKEEKSLEHIFKSLTK
jgi:ABC-2 type transport system ATP-binding protein